MSKQQIQRAAWHDYRSRCIYMITITKRWDQPPFSSLVGDYRLPTGSPGCSSTAMTPLGSIIQQAIRHLPCHEPAIKLLQYSVMPDHAHILLFVTRPTAEPIGAAIARMKAEINRSWGYGSVFNPGFNDQILKSSRSLQTLYDYIRDNPRRLAVRQALPDFFRRVRNITINGRRCQSYGNQFLLRCPFKEQVVVHRADDEATRRVMRERWLYAAANGGVLVSPFISPAEKAVRAEAEEAGGRVILISNNPFAERYKPNVREFDLCCRGRLLIVTPAGGEWAGEKVSREVCLAMNALAADIYAAGA